VSALGSGDVMIRTHFSIVSVGTENKKAGDTNAFRKRRFEYSELRVRKSTRLGARNDRFHTESFIVATQALFATHRSIQEQRVVFMNTHFPYDLTETGQHSLRSLRITMESDLPAGLRALYTFNHRVWLVSPQATIGRDSTGSWISTPNRGNLLG